MILIDRDILIDLLRSYAPAAQWAQTVPQKMLVVPGFVAMETLQGCSNRAAVERVEGLLAGYEIIWPRDADLRRALAQFGEHRLRHGLSAMDALIAETAIGANVPLHTFNVKHFAAFQQLVTIQPYTKTP
jgi:predicted nucleic acid-binding protein